MTPQRPAKPIFATFAQRKRIPKPVRDGAQSAYAELVSASTTLAIVFHLIIGLFILHPSCAGAQPAAQRFAALEQLYLENDQNQYSAFLIANFSEFLLLHPDSEFDSEALWMLADLYDSGRQSYRALLTYLKVLHFHPSGALADSARLRINRLMQKPEHPGLLEKSALIGEKLREQIAFENRPANHFELISFVYTLQITALDEILLEEISRYRLLYGDNREKEDILLLWQGRLNESLERYWQAAASYGLLLRLYPESSLRAEALLRSGIVGYTRLKLNEKSAQRFIEIINSYPGTEIAGEALYHLGRMHQVYLRNNKEALNNYQLLIESFPEHPRRAEAIRFSAQILEAEARYAEAAQYYNLFYTYFADDTLSANVLLKLADLYEKRLNNPQQAAATLQTFARQYSAMPTARKALFRAANLYAEAKQNKQAAEACRLLLEAYPNGTYAEKARALLKRLGEQP